MILGGISSEVLTELAFLTGKQSSADYIKIFKDHFLPFGESYYGNCRNVLSKVAKVRKWLYLDCKTE